jgi:hypothetical protein
MTWIDTSVAISAHIQQRYCFEGGLAERSKALVLKTSRRKRLAGSNPCTLRHLELWHHNVYTDVHSASITDVLTTLAREMKSAALLKQRQAPSAKQAHNLLPKGTVGLIPTSATKHGCRQVG